MPAGSNPHRRNSLLPGGRQGKKAWSSVNHTVLSGYLSRCHHISTLAKCSYIYQPKYLQHLQTSTHSNKTLFRIPPPWSDGAGPNSTGEGNILSLTNAGILHSSMPEDISGIFRRFNLWKKERVWTGRDQTKNECEQGGIKLTSLGVLILSYTPRPRLPCMRAQNIRY